MKNTYSIDYLFDADENQSESMIVSGREHWTVGMCDTNAKEEDEEEQFMTEHQSDNMESSR